MKRICFSMFGILCFISLIVSVSFADQVEDLLKSATENYQAKKYMKALEDIDWAQREISNMHMQVVQALLPESFPGYETNSIDGGAMFGVNSVGREYQKENQSIKITITGSQAGQAGMGLGAIMGMAAAFQSQEAGTKSKMIMCKGRKGQFNLDTESNTGTLTYTLNNNAFITIETEGFADESGAQMAAEKLDFDAIEKAYQ
ncbi:hypothetical protein JW979_07480 [bacterium]|nr:hypothetical protein [candidate division CSSED10-310 bacterium]